MWPASGEATAEVMTGATSSVDPKPLVFARFGAWAFTETKGDGLDVYAPFFVSRPSARLRDPVAMSYLRPRQRSLTHINQCAGRPLRAPRG